MMSKDNRYIKYARKYFESEEWTTPRTFSEQEAWLDMIFLASYAEHDIDLGKDGILTLQRGEFYCPQRQLAKRWGWPVSRVNRYFARLAEGKNPRIEKISRETHFETQSETQVETQIIIVRLCNYDSYNENKSQSKTHFETHFETQNETLKNKGILRIKGDKNTHTQYKSVRDYFVQACWRVRECAEACVDASKACEELLLMCGQDAEVAAIHKQVCKGDQLFDVMIGLYRYHSRLQQSFKHPIHPQQMQDLLRRYSIEDIWRLLEAIDNKRETIRGTSLYKTIKQWATTDIVIANRRREEQRIYS